MLIIPTGPEASQNPSNHKCGTSTFWRSDREHMRMSKPRRHRVYPIRQALRDHNKGFTRAMDSGASCGHALATAAAA